MMYITCWLEEDYANDYEARVNNNSSLEITELDFDNGQVQMSIGCAAELVGAIVSGLVQNFNAFSIEVLTDEEYNRKHMTLAVSEKEMQAWLEHVAQVQLEEQMGLR